MLSTIPIVLAGSMAMSLTGPIAPASAEDRDADRHKPAPTEQGKSIREALAAAHAASTAEATSSGQAASVAAAPASYTVVAGDTISGIAGRFGIPTASVLAMNGLGWKSVIHPGQKLTLSSGAAAPTAAAPAPTPAPSASRYTIVAGDTVARIAAKFGVPTAAVLSANGLSSSSIIYPGGTLAIPSSTAPAVASQAPIAARPAPSTPAAGGSHTIASGETIASIASKYGVTIQAILSANGLSWSSIIYGGRTLVIPSAAPAPVAPAASTAVGGSITPLTAEMARNASTIISVGRSLGVSDYGIVIALSAAMQESSLRNINFGDRDSLGLFQQRPSTGWGTAPQLTDPAYASRLFFGGSSNPNKGFTRGLLDIPNWQTRTVNQAAQAVQLSGHPDAYGKWETSARAWLAQLS
ncbi:muramidase family protein [Marisediminicola senii]|uniref:muramidase family protein n=1 Tax=Marisediminicola senii TaxID=2711233 RepID=UPI0013EA254C|nr:LysM peptidoglycan-binding domain-containing protein [Marisediminicola senii]